MNWTEHKAKWTECRRCALCKDRFSVCLYRGAEIPAQILFIGEGPGPSEDGSADVRHGLGKPFIGPAGDMLQEVIDCTIEGHYTYGLTNIVGCMPLDDAKKKYTDPPEYAIEACAPRVREIIQIVQPRLIFRVGKLAKEHVNRNEYRDIRFQDITHPGAIMKTPSVGWPLAIQRIEADVRSAIGDWLND